jgi:exopolysaccharide biosynthesis polyprenyl glycosylphosphotransferase
VKVFELEDDPSFLLKTATIPGRTREAVRAESGPERFEQALTVFEVAADMIAVVFAVLGGYGIYHWLQIGRRVHYAAGSLFLIASAVAVLFVLLLDRDGGYRPCNGLMRIKETERALRVSAQTFLLILPATFVSQHSFSRWAFAFAFVLVPILLITEKQLLFMAVRMLHSRGYGAQRVIIYGAGNTGRRILSALVRSPKLGLNPVCFVDDDPAMEGKQVFTLGYRRVSPVDVVPGPLTRELIEKLRCTFLVIATSTLTREQHAAVAKVADEMSVRLAFVPNQSLPAEYWTESADIDGLLLSIVGRPKNKWIYNTAKRVFDFWASFLLILALSPSWLLIALLVRLDSKGPVLFRQQRVGKSGKLFGMFKFRSMYVDAPTYGFSPTDAEDPRITKIGRLLRKTSLDELPQLINVLRGDMSLVGPRPEMPFIVEKYTPFQRQRLHVTPGITGLWQLSADRAFLIHENMQYDLYYIRNRNFFMDIAILLHTILFAMRGV